MVKVDHRNQEKRALQGTEAQEGREYRQGSVKQDEACSDKAYVQPNGSSWAVPSVSVEGYE